MNISDGKKMDLYSAIREPILLQRTVIKRSVGDIGVKNCERIDDLLFRLELKIWKEVKSVLNIQG